MCKVELNECLENSKEQCGAEKNMLQKDKLNHFWIILVIISLSLVIWSRPAQAEDNATLLNQVVGNYKVIAQATPSQPAPDKPVHLSLTLTKANGGAAITDATVSLTPNMTGMAMSGMTLVQAIAGQPSNVYSADIPVSMEGAWLVHVMLQSPGAGTANFDLSFTVVKPAPPWPLLVGLVIVVTLAAGLAWFFLLRNKADDDEEESNQPIKP